MVRGRVKITDIAKELGVSTSTVSRALSNEGRISAETRESVVNLAKKWGYKPNPFAINLLKKKSKNIGLILPEFTHHYFSEVLNGVSKVLTEKGYHLFINTHDGEIEKEIKAVEMLNSMRVDGIIASYARETSDFNHYLELIEDDVPLVFLDRMCEDLDTSYVVTDDFQGCVEAVNHLVSVGRTRIAHIHGPQNLSTSFNRFMGYKEALRSNGLNTANDLVLYCEHHDWKQKFENLLMTGQIDAVMCFNDYLAFEIEGMIRECGLSVPDAVSLVGFADEPVASYMTPKLTTVKQPAEKMGSKAAETLIWHIENPDKTEFICETLSNELIIRDSSDVKSKMSILKDVG